MKFTTMALLALPAVALAKPAPTSTAAPTSTPDPSVCEDEAGPYAEYCPRCEPRCADREGESYRQCLEGTFMIINQSQSQCWQHGGDDYTCKNTAIDEVCGKE